MQAFLVTLSHLLKKGVDVNFVSRGITPLMVASYMGKTDVVELLIEHGAEVNKCFIDNSTALMMASRRGHYEIVKLLLAHGPQSIMQKSDGLTALILAVTRLKL